MIAYCGIDCSKCDSYLATRSEDYEQLMKVAEKLSRLYRTDVKPEYVICDGCRDGKRHSFFCTNSCKMRKCCIGKEYDSCIECIDFPCKELQFEWDNSPEAKDNLKRSKDNKVNPADPCAMRQDASMSGPQLSTSDDFHEWIRLAKEVEPLFGPMTEDPAFHAGLRQAILDGDAFCMKALTGENRETLLGGIIISPKANEILWLAVTEKSRGQGTGKALLKEAIDHLDPGRPVTVTTFDGSVQAGVPARGLYHMCGFTDSQPGDLNPAGIPTVVMVRSTTK
jgi:GNAT superfamily N-acetyltransferase